MPYASRRITPECRRHGAPAAREVRGVRRRERVVQARGLRRRRNGDERNDAVDLVVGLGEPGADGFTVVSRRVIERAIRHSRCPEEVNDDGAVDEMALSIVLGGWGMPGWGSGADFKGEDLVDGCDRGAVLGMWGPCDQALCAARPAIRFWHG